MSRSFLERYSVPLAAAAVSAAALGTWQVRGGSSVVAPEKPEHPVRPVVKPEPDAAAAKRVADLLERSSRADTQLSYSAVVTLVTNMGGKAMRSQARLIRAPRKLSITYIGGDGKGMSSGYNERWFWRRDNSRTPMEAYAAVAYRPDEMAAQRLRLLLKNYPGRLLGEGAVDGRPADIVELSPARPVEGARGPLRRMWIDRATGLTLRTDTFNHKGEAMMTSTVSRLDLSPQITQTTFVPPGSMAKVAVKRPWMAEEMGAQRESVARASGLQPPAPAFVPSGFAFDSVGIHRCEDRPGAVIAALSRYGDGLNILTIFALSEGAAKPDALKSSGRSKNDLKNLPAAPVVSSFGHGTMAMRHTPDGLLVAVADLPAPVLKRVLASTKIVRAPRR